jgi:hypothetical protein
MDSTPQQRVRWSWATTQGDASILYQLCPAVLPWARADGSRDICEKHGNHVSCVRLVVKANQVGSLMISSINLWEENATKGKS